MKKVQPIPKGKHKKENNSNRFEHGNVVVTFSRPLRSKRESWLFTVFVDNNIIHIAKKRGKKFGFGHARAFAKKLARTAVGKYTASYRYMERDMLSAFSTHEGATTFFDKSKKYPIFKDIKIHDPQGCEIRASTAPPTLKAEMVATS